MIETFPQEGATRRQVGALALELAVLVEDRGHGLQIGGHGLANGQWGHGVRFSP